ncbi:TPA: hypothetical protein L1M97_004913 [Escherichia coli]|nr:hypothetical protein [Escherichia coli]EFG6525388.1 hypothetical protein [Escherichia coli]EGI7083262.1 hypothetical protein [Escherichia coli]EHX8355280.1 hypothetical protein [Escherichia coli]NZD11762.1 hypothetical protein [Escherichia coli]HBN0448026.1 hypothetical protein [Escherichia coli]
MTTSVHLRKGMYGSKPNGYRTVRTFRSAFTFSELETGFISNSRSAVLSQHNLSEDILYSGIRWQISVFEAGAGYDFQIMGELSGGRSLLPL